MKWLHINMGEGKIILAVAHIVTVDLQGGRATIEMADGQTFRLDVSDELLGFLEISLKNDD